MGLCLIADMASTLASIGDWAWIIGSVGVSLGFVIFVHEAGHFLVAKWCGVKCEKFYVGFDVPMPKVLGYQIPSSFGKFQWGETEYGIGIIPLGGYVKMLGQDDDPRNAAKEAERIRMKKEGKGTPGPEEVSSEPQVTPETEREKALSAGTSAEGLESGTTVEKAEADEDYELDPRSFPAKTVPQRMAIISAGVIVNLIFAVIFAAVAFRMGVPYPTCDIGTISPGSPAWFANMQPNCKIIQLGKNGKRSERLRFDWDLSNAGVGLSGTTEDLYLLVREADGTEKEYSIRPAEVYRPSGARPMLGVGPQSTLQVSDTIKSMSAGATGVGLKSKDVVIAVNGRSVLKSADVREAFIEGRSETIVLTIERLDADQNKETLDISIAPQPLKRVGLVMKSSSIVGIRPNSPADKAGIKKGDILVSVAGNIVEDPMLVPAYVAPHYGEEVEIQVHRGEELLTVSITPQVPQSYDWQLNSGLPMGVDAIGLAYDIGLEVKSVMANSSAAKAGIQPGDTLTSVQFVSDDPEGTKTKRPVALKKGEYDWQTVFSVMQAMEPEAKVKLGYSRGTDAPEEIALLTPVASEVFAPERGLVLARMTDKYVATSWGEALALGYAQTKRDALRVVKVLRKLVTGGISPMNLGGPMTIAVVAASETSEGLPRLLIFLTFLSANLAVLNFLPIPALDGGHMVFLVAEGILRRPIDERLQGALTLAGVCSLLLLMLFVFGLDIHRWFIR